MASNQPSHIDEIEKVLICSLCLDILKSPKTLPCTHSFCEECLQRYVDDDKVSNDEGIHCPCCKTLFKSGEFIDIYRLQELLQLYWKCKKGIIPPCFICESEENKVIWKCNYCKVSLCEGCQKVHKKLPNCKTHQCIPYNVDTEQVIDDNYYCESHPDQVIDLYCAKCEKLICLKCKVTNHDKHRSKTIDAAIASVTQDVQKSLKLIQNQVGVLQDENKAIKKDVDCVEMESTKQEEELKKLKQQYLSEIEKWETDTLKVLADIKQGNLKKLQEAIEINERQIKIKDSVVQLTNVNLASVKGYSLLTSLTDKVIGRLAQEEKVTHSKVNVTHPQWNCPVTRLSSATAQISLPPSTSVPVQQFYSSERLFDADISEVMQKIRNVSLHRVNLEGCPGRLCLIGENIWIGQTSEYAKYFYIFDTSSKTTKVCSVLHDTGMRSFCQTADKTVVAACETGLVVLNLDGKFLLKFSELSYKDLCTHNRNLFAITSKSHFLDIYGQVNGPWQYLQRVSMGYHFSGDDTIITDHACLYICVKGLSKIWKYSLQGGLINEFGSKGTEPGEFRMPSVCGIDKCGNLIVCDSKNHRIQVMTNNHMWLEYSLSQVSFPNDILMHEEFVYILSGRMEKRKLLWCNIMQGHWSSDIVIASDSDD